MFDSTYEVILADIEAEYSKPGPGAWRGSRLMPFVKRDYRPYSMQPR